ncbi:FxsA family protein [Neotabrizicola shimadae]|uniref:FxsA family protein n=1 Tax=Neotabrizicola shimadae TaxID=2807096 RepID=A0A8G0ZS21_9RHOB|nr:FxsA family protein [Neotabrizicola shimadae]QYZ69424.1 FxsA family protein [Neotabrizicola shimadae]
MPVMLLFVLLPLVEIAGFVIVGGWIGLWPTLALVVLAVVLGAAVIRRQGAGLAYDLRGEMGQVRDPLSPMAHRAMKVLAGGLLIIPGFVTDIAALLLLLPPVRQGIINAMAARMGPVVRHGGPSDNVTVIDAEYYEVDPGSVPRRQGPSGWTQP